MRKLIIAFSAGLFLITNLVHAQQKLGHVNSDAIFANYSEVKTAAATAESFAKSKQTEIDKMVNEFQAKLKTAQDKQKTLTAANKDKLTKELGDAETELKGLGGKIEELRTKSTKDVSDKQNELFAPIQKKVGDAIAAVAKEKGLAYVFDTSKSQGNSNIGYYAPNDDITAAVKTKLGIK